MELAFDILSIESGITGLIVGRISVFAARALSAKYFFDPSPDRAENAAALAISLFEICDASGRFGAATSLDLFFGPLIRPDY